MAGKKQNIFGKAEAFCLRGISDTASFACKCTSKIIFKWQLNYCIDFSMTLETCVSTWPISSNKKMNSNYINKELFSDQDLGITVWLRK